MTAAANSISQSRSKFKHHASIMLRQVFASLELKNRAKLLKAALASIKACLPECYEESCRSWVIKLTASPSSLQRARLLLDLSMMRAHASRMRALGPVLRYGWGDATVKHGRDWYNSRHRYVSKDTVLQLARAAKWLSAHPFPVSAKPLFWKMEQSPMMTWTCRS